MAQFLFVLHMPPSSTGTEVRSNATTIDWSQFEPKVKSIGLPEIVSNKPSKKSQRLSRNLWLLAAEDSAQQLAAGQQLAASFDLAFSALLVSGDVTPMSKS